MSDDLEESITAPVETDTSRSSKAAAPREMSVQTLVHLLGIPTSQEVAVLESKVDTLLNKLGAIQNKLEKLQAEASRSEGMFERIEHQIADVKSTLKRLTQEPSKSVASTAGVASNPRNAILSSTPAADATKARCSDDDAFQQAEAQRVRNKAEQK